MCDTCGCRYQYNAMSDYYPGFLQKRVTLPVAGSVMLGTVVITVVISYFAIKSANKYWGKKTGSIPESEMFWEEHISERERYGGGCGCSQ